MKLMGLQRSSDGKFVAQEVMSISAGVCMVVFMS